MPNQYDLAQEFRARVLAGEQQAAGEMVQAYGQVWESTKSDLDGLTKQIEAEKAAGRKPDVAWLLRQERFRALLAQTEERLLHFARFADRKITDQQATAVDAAQQAAYSMVHAALGQSGVSTAFNRLPTAAVQRMVGRLSDGTPLNRLLGQFGKDGSAAVRKALVTGIATGKSPKVIGREAREALGGDLTRALMISRTEVLGSYREASRESYQENSHLVSGWIWLASLSARTCAMCIAMHGTEHPLSEPMGSHPRCRCTMAPKTKRWQPIETGPEWFAKQKPDLQGEILGPAKLAAYQDGKLSLSDVVGYRDDPDWGPTRWELSLKVIQSG